MTNKSTNYVNAKGVKATASLLKKYRGQFFWAHVILDTDECEVILYVSPDGICKLGSPYVLIAEACCRDCRLDNGLPLDMRLIKNRLRLYDEYLCWLNQNSKTCTTFETYLYCIGD